MRKAPRPTAGLDDFNLSELSRRVFGRQVPNDALERFRTNTLALAGVLGVIACFAFEIEFRLLGVTWQSAGTYPIAVAMAAVLLAHRRHGRFVLTLNLLLCTFFALTAFYTYFLGGVRSAAIWWFLALPYVTVTCALPRLGLFWSAVCVVAVLVFLGYEQAGHAFPSTPVADMPLVHVVSLLLLSAQLIGFLTLLERARTASTRELQHSNTALITARDEALAAAHSKAVFLANMSHEIRTPLNGVLGMAELLGQSTLTDAQQRFVRTLRHSGEHLMHVINDVLDFSKLEARRVELERIAFSPRDIVERLAEAMTLEARAKGLALTLEVDADVPAMVVGDPSRVRQILFNLTANAIKFTPAGRVSLALRTGHGYVASTPVLEFEVADTGIGIGADELPRLFKAFSQADGSTTRLFGGTGLGLAISRELARMMHGEIEVDSVVDAGSRFRCTLRFDHCASRPDATQPERPPGTVLPFDGFSQPPRVLLVEDNPVNCEVGTAMLEQLGCRVEVAHEGAAALKHWLAGPYDVVLMDCQMPVMDGYAATRTIRGEERARNLPRTPIVAMTANAFREDRDACLEAGMDDFLSKPYTLLQLKQVIEAHTIRARAA
jgi:signal transduction histidine kinase/CheY-like chemotaxis protein